MNSNQALADSNQSGGHLHILLADDDDDFVNLIAKELSEGMGHRTTVARSGDEAAELLEAAAGRYDILLLDYDMKGMSGLDLLRWMRQREIELPVIMLTGAGSEEVAVDAMKLGAYDYARKEQIDLPHLAVVIQATHERRMFRVERTLEAEREHETGLTDEATERMRDVVGAISHTIQSSFSNIAAEMEHGKARVGKLSDQHREPVQTVLNDLQRQVGVLESGLGGFLKLYRLVYAHHAGRDEIQQIKQEFFEKVKPATPKSPEEGKSPLKGKKSSV